MANKSFTQEEKARRLKMLALKLYQVQSFALDKGQVISMIDFFLYQWCFSDADMAFVLGISRPKFSELRNGKREPTKTEIAKFAAIGFPVQQFFVKEQ